MAKTIPQLGFHYFPDDRHFTDQDLYTWLPILASLEARWLTLRASARRAIPENFIKGLMEAGIEQIIHIPHPVGKMDDSSLRPILEAYARWDVRFVIIYDRPNLRDYWANDAWHKKGLVERFVDIALPTLQLVRSSGLMPVLPPLEPGGDYWDTAFLEGVLRSIKRRRQESLLRDLNISFYAWTYDRPEDWGIGGPEKWDSARPYMTSEGSQDHRGFRIFDWYDTLALNSTGQLMPLICVGAGSNQRYAESNPAQHEQSTLAIIKTLEEGNLPPTVRNINFYLLSCGSHHSDFENAWFPSIEAPIATVHALRKYLSSRFQVARKPLRHYVLLPEGTNIQDVVTHDKVAEILRNLSPVVGYSPIEAQLARTVTLVGDQDAVAASIEQDLIKAGCTVKRISPEIQPDLVDEKTFKKEDHVQALIHRLVRQNGGREK